MDQERKEHLIRSYSLGRKRYILQHGVLNWGISTAIIYRTILMIITYGWSLDKVVKGILSIQTLFAMVLFGFIGLIFGHFMWKWIEKTVKSFPPEPTKTRASRIAEGKKKTKKKKK